MTAMKHSFERTGNGYALPVVPTKERHDGVRDSIKPQEVAPNEFYIIEESELIGVTDE